MLTIAHAEDSFLSGEVDFRDWREEFEAQWFMPLGDALMAGLIASLPENVRAQMRAMQPEFTAIEERYARS